MTCHIDKRTQVASLILTCQRS